MDAQLVWDTWRRILRSDELVQWVLEPQTRAGAPAGLTAAETAILTDYAATPAATATNIGMYRRGLVRNALGALDLVPLSRRLLLGGGSDSEAVATDFAGSIGYADNGPDFWRTAAAFVAYLAGRPEFASRAQQDVLAMDAATIALARRLSRHAPPAWPDDAAAVQASMGAPGIGEEAPFVASSAAVVVSSECDLTGWIEDPFGFDPGEDVEFSPRHWLIYFPAAEAAQEYAELSDRAARIFRLLSVPRAAAELSPALPDVPRADVRAVLGGLAGLGVVTGGTSGAVAGETKMSDRAAEAAPVHEGSR